jgi:hypothetical protein
MRVGVNDHRKFSAQSIRIITTLSNDQAIRASNPNQAESAGWLLVGSSFLVKVASINEAKSGWA